MNTWCSKHVQDAKNWIKTLIWKMCIDVLRYITNLFFYLQIHILQNEMILQHIWLFLLLISRVVCLNF
jgi:hypothetical protein